MRRVRSHASSQPSRASSSKIRISSATAIAGWVSLSWTATLSGRAFQSLPRRRNRADDVGQRTGDQKVLLDEPQVAAAGSGIVRVKNAGQHLGGDLLVDGVEEIAAAELQEIEILVGGGAPEPERVDGLPAVADDRPIIGNSAQDRRHVRRHGQPPLPHLERAIELDFHGLSRPNDLPGIGTDQPVIRMFDLPAVLDLLAEHAVFVAQSITDRRDLERGQRVEKAGGQPAEPSIAQPRVGLLARTACASLARRPKRSRCGRIPRPEGW